MEPQTQSNAEDAVKAYLAVWNRHDLDASATMLDPNIVLYSSLFPEGVKGKEAHGKIDENFFKSMPDFEFRILNIAAKGEFVAAELVGAGTSKGPSELPGRAPLPPTGRRVEFGLGSFFRVNSRGLIEEERYYYDKAGFIQQLGLNA